MSELLGRLSLLPHRPSLPAQLLTLNLGQQYRVMSRALPITSIPLHPVVLRLVPRISMRALAGTITYFGPSGANGRV
jgi:hypothetical protein